MKPHDYQNDEEKSLSREYNLRQVQRCRALFDAKRGKLLHDWAELPGHGAPTLGLLRERGWLGPAKFLGVEQDPTVFDSIVGQHGESGPCHRFFSASLERWLWRGCAKDVGVLNFDTEHMTRGDTFHTSVSIVTAFARRQERLLGNFVLIINAGLDRGATLSSFQEVMREHGVHVCPQHLDEPGVRYGSARPKRNSRRINYAVIFGPARAKFSEEPHPLR